MTTNSPYSVISVSAFERKTGPIYVDAFNEDDPLRVQVNKADLIWTLRATGYSHVEILTSEHAITFIKGVTK